MRNARCIMKHLGEKSDDKICDVSRRSRRDIKRQLLFANPRLDLDVKLNNRYPRRERPHDYELSSFTFLDKFLENFVVYRKRLGFPNRCPR